MRGTTPFDVFYVKIGSGPLAVERWKNPEKISRVNIFDAQFREYGESNPLRIVTKFCATVDNHDVITYAIFCDDRLRGLGVARGRISRFSIDLRRRPCSCNTRTTYRARV